MRHFTGTTDQLPEVSVASPQCLQCCLFDRWPNKYQEFTKCGAKNLQ